MVEKTQAAKPPRAAWFGAARLGDLALVGGTLATAFGAVGFAGFMTLTGTPSPHINGMQYLAIFAQPTHRLPAAAIDMSPVGAVAAPARTETGGYKLVGARESYAWLREGDHIFAVRPGDDVPNLGHVATIQTRDGRWTLLDDKGAALIASAVPALAATGEGRFGKQMIFGANR